MVDDVKVCVRNPNERGRQRRVALVPETVEKLVARKLEVLVESGALGAAVTDDDYVRARRGNDQARAKGGVIAGADVVIKVHPPRRPRDLQLHAGATLISLLYPLAHRAQVAALAARGVSALALMPSPAPRWPR